MKVLAAIVLTLLPLHLEARFLCGGNLEDRPEPSGGAYTLDLRVAEGASEVRIEESRNATFDLVRIVVWQTGTPAPVFTHLASEDTPLYYRITTYDATHHNIDACPTVQRVTIVADRRLRDSFRRSVIPVVHRAEGVVTSLSLFNSYHAEALSGRIIFRKAGVPGRSNDPAISYMVLHGRSVYFEDILRDLGVHGLGSLDIVPDDNGPAWVPETQVRIRHVTAETASSGMEVPQVRVGDFAGATALSIHATDEAQARTSVGIRSWNSGASIVVHVDDEKQTRDVDIDLPGDTFRQYSLDELAGFHVETPATVFITAKGAVVYAIETDNLSNESRLRIGYGELEGEKTFVGDFFQ
jgi:hypothetical protein